MGSSFEKNPDRLVQRTGGRNQTKDTSLPRSHHLPDLVLYFKIPDSSPESFDLRDIPWVTIHLLVASVGGSTVMVEAISTSTSQDEYVDEPQDDDDSESCPSEESYHSRLSTDNEMSY
nr:hypothetical protein [Tanacetum cinerariifolium]GEZ15532.1 hypothetical protein [Tanacetum cinerariifolium]